MFSTVHPPRILVNTYHHELLVQYAWRPMHPPLKSFFEVATYRARISRVFACYLVASGISFESPLIYQHCFVFEA